MTLTLYFFGKNLDYKLNKNKIVFRKTKKTKFFQSLIFIMPVIIISVLTFGIVTPFYRYKKNFSTRAIETCNSFDSNLSDPSKLLTIVNSENSLPKTYNLNLRNFKGFEFDQSIIHDLKKMLNDAKDQNINLKIIEGYMSLEEQKNIYDSKIDEISQSEGISHIKAKRQVEKIFSPPGKDEHQTGLTVCITDEAESDNFKLTKESEWLQKNSVNYGFIVRYPKGKKSITKKKYNPNFFRYVGTYNAQKMRIMNMCLEEYVSYLDER